MSIVKDAQEYLRSQGLDQWQNGYPNVEQIELDIAENESYVVYTNEGEIVGTTVLCTRGEKTYDVIEDGQWLTPEDSVYGVIHRLAVKKESRGSGVAKFIFKTCEEMLVNDGIRSMRIDTHEGNKGMQKLISDMGYQYCGVIYLESGDKRLAYEKVL